jgi:hypothetical protein
MAESALEYADSRPFHAGKPCLHCEWDRREAFTILGIKTKLRAAVVAAGKDA